jgi:hypothetical protein
MKAHGLVIDRQLALGDRPHEENAAARAVGLVA